MRALSVVCVFVLGCILITCTNRKFEPIVCFQDDVLPIFVKNCTMAGCHDGTVKKSGYNTYDGIMTGITAKHPLNSEIYGKISGSNPEMPPKPYPKLSSNDLAIIKKWIRDGAHNSYDCKGCDTSVFSYSGKVRGILDSWCVGCHNINSIGTPYDLTTYTGVKAAIEALNDPLLGSVKHATGFSAMPKGTTQLSDCDIKAIQYWISSGYPNN